MGCDIHASLEYKVDDEWVDLNLHRKNYYDKKFETINYKFTGRCYSLFAMLADVRNDYHIEPISQPKGIPDDACQTTKDEYDTWAPDAHSASWLTLKELIDAEPNHRFYKVTAMISPSQAEELDNYGNTPTGWCQWTNRTDWVKRTFTIETDCLQRMIDEIKEIAQTLIYCEFAYDWDKDEQNLKERVRVVFWFDN